MKKTGWIVGSAIATTAVQAAVLDGIGNSFRRIFTNQDFMFFLFYVLVFGLLTAIFNGGAGALPMFRDKPPLRKTFAVTLGLLVTTLIFTNYRGGLYNSLSDALGPYGWWSILLIAAVIVAIVLLANIGRLKGGEGKGGFGTVLKWLLILLAIWLALGILMNGGDSIRSGSGYSLGKNPGDILFNILHIILLGVFLYLIFLAIKAGGFGGGGSEGRGRGERGLLSRLNPFRRREPRAPGEKMPDRQRLRDQAKSGNLKVRLVDDG